MCLSYINLSASDFSDLYEDENDIYGSEKDEKYSVNSFIIEVEDWNNHYSFMFFGFFKYTDYPKYKSLRFLPFYYSVDSKIDNRQKTILFIPYPYYYEKNGDSTIKADIFGYSYQSKEFSHKSILYIYYYGNNKDNVLYNSFFPLYSYKSQNYNDTNSKFMTTFLFNYYSSKDKVQEEQSFTSLLFHYSYDYNKINSNYQSSLFLPILPLLYFNKHNNETNHYAFLSLFHIYSKNNDIYKIQSPILFYKEDSYINFPLLLTFNYYDKNAKKYNIMWNPLFSYKKDSDLNIHPLLAFNHYSTNYRLNISPIYAFYYDNNIKTTAFPVIPIFWYHRYEKFDSLYEDTYNILSIYRYRKKYSSEGVIDKTFFLLPLYYNYSSSNYNSTICPLYFSSEKNTETSKIEKFGLPFIPLLYYSKNGDNYRVKQYLTLIRFEEDLVNNTSKSISPIHYYQNDNDITKFYSPLWFYKRDKENAYGYNFINPIYYNYKNSKQDTTLFLPFYFKSNSEDNYTYINLFGYAKTINSGIVQNNQTTGIGKSDGVWYADVNFTWLYNFIGIYFRFPLSKKDNYISKNNVDENILLNDEESNELISKSPSIITDDNNSRGESLNFFGVDLFYGIFSYQKSDTMNHIRLLPLAWFTWYEDSDEGVSFIPGAYFHYNKDETKYFVLFPAFIPIYGEQQKGNSYTKAWGGIIYWDQYDSEKEVREKSFLWPLINSYQDNNSSSWRIFPFAYHKENFSNNDFSSKTFTLLSYSSQNITKDIMGVKLSEKSNIYTPFFYNNINYTNGDYNRTLFIPIIPLYYYNIENDETTYRFCYTAFYYYSSSQSESVSIFYNLYRKRTSNNYNSIELFFGLYSDFEDKSNQTISKMFFPFYTYSEKPNEKYESYCLNLYYNHSFKGGNTNAILWPIYTKKTTDNYSYLNIFPLFYKSNNKESDNTLFIYPLLSFYNNSPDKVSYNNPLFVYQNNKNTSSFYALPLLLSYYSNTSLEGDKKRISAFTLGLIIDKSPLYTRYNYLYLLDYEKSKIQNRTSYKMLFSSVDLTLNPDYNSFQILYGSAFEYNNFQNSDYDLSIGTFIYKQYNKNKTYYTSCFPIWWYKENTQFQRTVILPLLSYRYKDTNQLYESAALGLLWYSNQNFKNNSGTSHLLLGTLYYHRKKEERLYRSYGQLWGLLWNYEIEDETNYKSFSFLKFVFKRTEINNDVQYKILGFNI